jgi:hypothetical protein
MRTIVFISSMLAIVVIGGCSGDVAVPPSKLEKPAAYLMVAPEPLFNVAAGDDYGQALIKTRKMYGKETSKLRRLQRYVRVITK